MEIILNYAQVYCDSGPTPQIVRLSTNALLINFNSLQHHVQLSEGAAQTSCGRRPD